MHYNLCIVGHGYGERNPEGTRILELCTAADLILTNTHFTKKMMLCLITYRSGNSSSQIDYVLVRWSNLKSLRDIKVIWSEECVLQQKLLVCDLELNTSLCKPKALPPKRKLWKLKFPEVSELLRTQYVTQSSLSNTFKMSIRPELKSNPAY